MISQLLGWSYFFCWSISFYPQILLNYKRKSCVGLSLDFVWLNILGFSCYSIYTFAFYYDPITRREYKNRYGTDNAVQPNDLVFAIHALLITIITLSQTLIYPYSKPHLFTRIFIGCSIGGFGMIVYGIYQEKLEWLLGLYYLSSVKMIISFIKYLPQIIVNYQRKSTLGWSIHNILLDFSGGLLSILQSVVDAIHLGNWNAITGNWVKFGMGLSSIIFDLIFIAQHYILYRSEEQDPLLPTSQSRDSYGEVVFDS
jgi:cystinosin